MGRISQYLNELKTRTGYTQQQISEITGIPIGTVPRYFADMEDDSANFEIVRKLVVAMHGSLDELAGIAPKRPEISEKQLSADSYSEIVRNYQAIVASLEARLSEKDERILHRTDLAAVEHQRAKDDIAAERLRSENEIRHERKCSMICLVVAFAALGILVAGLFILDFFLPAAGWIRR